MLTINAEIKKDGLRSDGTYNVKLRFTLNRKMRRLATSLFATSKDLNKELKIKQSSPIKKEIDSLIRGYQEKCAKLQVELNRYTIDEVMDYLDGEHQKQQTIDFIKFSREWITSTTIKGAPNYTTAINALVRFIGKEELDVNLITTNFLDSFKAFLNKEREVRTKKLILQGKRVPSNRSLSLYLVSINVWKLPYKDMKKGYKSTCRYNLAKDCFILSFCLMGINSADLYNATEMVNNTIIYNRTKTKDRRLDNAQMKVDIPKIALPFIEKYRDKSGKRLFNFYQYYADEKGFNKAINYGLKEIGTILGVDDLEYYAARHSWATIALNKVGIHKYIVHAALNHIDDSMKVTDIYIERDFVNENKANAKVVKYVFGK